MTVAPESTGNRIRTLDELREITGEPKQAALDKERDHLLPVHRQWLAASRFCLLATSGADGTCDVSPKGDPAGFAHVIDDRTVAIPERPGNARADGWANVLQNPHVGLIFLVPGRNDTLRIGGGARLVRDGDYFDALAVRGRRPLLAMEVDVEQVFFHCPKAFLRSDLWQPETWPARDALPSVAALSQQLARPHVPLAELERYYGEGLREHLY